MGDARKLGGDKLQECCKEQGQLAEVSEEGLGTNGGSCANGDDDDDVSVTQIYGSRIKCFSDSES